MARSTVESTPNRNHSKEMWAEGRAHRCLRTRKVMKGSTRTMALHKGYCNISQKTLLQGILCSPGLRPPSAVTLGAQDFHFGTAYAILLILPQLLDLDIYALCARLTPICMADVFHLWKIPLLTIRLMTSEGLARHGGDL